MRFVCVLYTVLAFYSCKQKGITEIRISKINGLCIVDTTQPCKDYIDFDQSYTGYPIYYIGAETDTVKIGNHYKRVRQYNFDGPRHIKTYSDATLRLFVDTSIAANTRIEYFSRKEQRIFEDSTKNYHSFLLIIKNISDSIVYMGRTTSLFFMWREAKDTHGNWIKIDKRLSEFSLCLTGKPMILLNPKELLISKIKRYKGNFVTDFRIGFGYDNNVVYSNTFRDSIDKRTLAIKIEN